MAELERNLKAQVAAEERLLTAIELQRESVRRLSAEDLRRALAEASAAVEDIARVQGDRRRLLVTLLGGDPSKGGAITADLSSVWATILERIPPDTRNRLMSLRQRARDLADRVARVNGINRRVTERARAHFTGLLETLAGGGNTTYARRSQGCVAVGPTCANALIDRVA